MLLLGSFLFFLVLYYSLLSEGIELCQKLRLFDNGSDAPIHTIEAISQKKMNTLGVTYLSSGSTYTLHMKESLFRLATVPEPIMAYTYNQQYPGPTLEVDLHSTITIRVHNELPVSTSLHFHGIEVPFEIDGLTAKIEPGDSFSFPLTLNTPGLKWFHAHHKAEEQIRRGLYGVIVVREKTRLDEENKIASFVRQLYTAPSPVTFSEHFISIDDIEVDDNGIRTDFSFQGVIGGALEKLSAAHNGIEGSRIMINGQEVEDGLLLDVEGNSISRFRILNASASRFVKVDFLGDIPFDYYVIGSDGGLFQIPVKVNNDPKCKSGVITRKDVMAADEEKVNWKALNIISPGERLDIILVFKQPESNAYELDYDMSVRLVLNDMPRGRVQALDKHEQQKVVGRIDDFFQEMCTEQTGDQKRCLFFPLLLSHFMTTVVSHHHHNGAGEHKSHSQHSSHSNNEQSHHMHLMHNNNSTDELVNEKIHHISSGLSDNTSDHSAHRSVEEHVSLLRSPSTHDGEQVTSPGELNDINHRILVNTEELLLGEDGYPQHDNGSTEYSLSGNLRSSNRSVDMHANENSLKIALTNSSDEDSNSPRYLQEKIHHQDAEMPAHHSYHGNHSRNGTAEEDSGTLEKNMGEMIQILKKHQMAIFEKWQDYSRIIQQAKRALDEWLCKHVECSSTLRGNFSHTEVMSLLFKVTSAQIKQELIHYAEVLKAELSAGEYTFVATPDDGVHKGYTALVLKVQANNPGELYRSKEVAIGAEEWTLNKEITALSIGVHDPLQFMMSHGRIAVEGDKVILPMMLERGVEDRNHYIHHGLFTGNRFEDIVGNLQAIRLDEAMDIVVTNHMGSAHNFHMHGFRFQEIDVHTLTPALPIRWKDTIIVPPNSKNSNGEVRLRVKAELLGRSVQEVVNLPWLLHCHINSHHTLNMYSFVNVIAGFPINNPYIIRYLAKSLKVWHAALTACLLTLLLGAFLLGRLKDKKAKYEKQKGNACNESKVSAPSKSSRTASRNNYIRYHLAGEHTTEFSQQFSAELQGDQFNVIENTNEFMPEKIGGKHSH